MSTQRIVLPGGTGFLGQILTSHLQRAGHDVVVLSRHPGATKGGVRFVHWDGEIVGSWAEELEGADAVVNLAGQTVNCRYHQRNRKGILDSRVNSTRALGEAFARCHAPPRVWLNSSTATIYKHSLDRPMDEAKGAIGATPEAKDAFSVEVAIAWEQAVNEVPLPATRKVLLRTAMVLSASGSVFTVLRRLVRWGLGGTMGSGRQYVSWIHELDFCRAVDWILAREELAGPVNVTAPNPLPNRELMRLLRERAGVRIGLPATKWMLEAGAFCLRTETELILKSRWVLPGRLLESGLAFRFPEFVPAARELCSRGPSDRPLQ